MSLTGRELSATTAVGGQKQSSDAESRTADTGRKRSSLGSQCPLPTKRTSLVTCSKPFRMAPGEIVGPNHTPMNAWSWRVPFVFGVWIVPMALCLHGAMYPTHLPGMWPGLA